MSKAEWQEELAKHLEQEGNHKFAQIMRKGGYSESDLKRMAEKRGISLVDTREQAKVRRIMERAKKARESKTAKALAKWKSKTHKNAFERGCKVMGIDPDKFSPQKVGLYRREIIAVGLMSKWERKIAAKAAGEGIKWHEMQWSEQLGAKVGELAARWRTYNGKTTARVSMDEGIAAEFEGYCALTNQNRDVAITTLVASALAAYRDGHWGGSVPGTALALIEERLVGLIAKGIKLESAQIACARPFMVGAEAVRQGYVKPASPIRRRQRTAKPANEEGS